MIEHYYGDIYIIDLFSRMLFDFDECLPFFIIIITTKGLFQRSFWKIFWEWKYWKRNQ